MSSSTLWSNWTLTSFAALALLLVLATNAFLSRKGRNNAAQLPGPKGLPLVGNAFDIPKSHAWLKFAEWAHEYGSIYQVKAFGTTLVIISKESIANDLLGLRGAIYSDRPPLIMPRLVSDNGFLGAMGWNDHWRRARRFAQTMLSSSNVSLTVPKQTTEAKQMVVDMCEKPAEYVYWLERAGVMSSLQQIYGITEARGTAEEHHVHEICSYMETIERVAIPGAYLVEFLPALQYLPEWVVPFKREAGRLVDKHWRYCASLLQTTPGSYAAKDDSMLAKYSRTTSEGKLPHRELVWALSSIYGGAAGTSSSALQTIMLNMCLFPEWQDRLHQELDRVVGDDRSPSNSDLRDLPVARAIIKESLRWRPVLPGGG